jgi:hypothetical protein
MAAQLTEEEDLDLIVELIYRYGNISKANSLSPNIREREKENRKKNTVLNISISVCH